MPDSENRFGRLVPASFRYAITSDTDVHTYVLRQIDRRNLAHVVKHFDLRAGDTGRDHAPGNLAGVIMFFAARAAREADDPDAFHAARREIASRTSAIVHVHEPRPFYCGECEVIHADSTDCRA